MDTVIDRRMSRRRAAGAGAAAVGGLLAAACGAAGRAPAMEGPAAGSALATKQPATLTWWAGNGQDPGFAGIRDAFVQRFPNVTVNYEGEAAHLNPEKLIAALLADQAPDVTRYADAGLGDLASKGALRVLDDHVRRSRFFKKDDFYPRLLESGKWAGKFHAIPFLTDTRPLFWNKETFKAEGIPPEKGPTTWDELKEYTVRLTRRSAGGFERVGYVPHYAGITNSHLYLYGWLNGAEPVQLSPDGKKQRCTLNDAKWVKALEYMADLFTVLGGKERIDAWRPEAHGSGAQHALLTGKLAMLISTDTFARTFGQYAPDLDYGYALPPAPRGKQALTWSGIWNVVVPTGAKRPEEGAEFAAFAAAVEGMRAWAEGTLQDFRARAAGAGYWYPAVSTNRAGGEAIFAVARPQMPERGQQIYRFSLNALQTSRSRPVIPAGLEIWDAQTNATADVLAGKGTPAAVLDDYARRVNAKFQELGVLM